MGMGTPLSNGPIGLGTLWGTGLFGVSSPIGEFFFFFLFLRLSPGRGCSQLQPPLVRR